MPFTAHKTRPRSWTLELPERGELTLDARPGRARVMGIVNVTPDSFSDGGLWLDPERAVEHGLALLDQGADLLDLGAESTRPAGATYGAGADAVPAQEEWRRLEPVLRGLRAQTAAPLSVDTRKGAVARRALDAGADLINDVTALADPDLAAAVADAGCPVVLMHLRGDTASMQELALYDDVAAEVRNELATALARAEAAGIARRQTVVDPGIGFAKTAPQSYELLAHLEVLAELGRPILVGASRKSFLTHAGGAEEPAERLPGSLAAALWSAGRGAAVVRVHDVEQTVRALAVWRRLAQAAQPAAARREEAR